VTTVARTGDVGPKALDVLVLGSGVAGLSAAVRLASGGGGAKGLRVGVLTKGRLSESATWWAQGGVAAVLGGDVDSTDLHLADTLAAGAGLCDVDAVRVLVDEGPVRVQELIALGAVFDRQPSGDLALAREGGHSMARVLHAGGAATGMEVERALVAATRKAATAVLESWFAVDLLLDGGRCVGVVALDPTGAVREVRARHTVLATGGVGQLFAVTTNPAGATGDGLAMAIRAGVAVADVEFMQFHPTALHHPAMPRPLLSEALRGHGALLRDTEGERFVDELAPRDVVSRAMASRMRDQGVDHLWLDATGLESFASRFPTIAASLDEIGLDPGSEWLPIAPAAHHLAGGVVTDLVGATELPGLWAAGEVACTGVHGANRLASNSLLEGMVFGARLAEALRAGVEGPSPTGVLASLASASLRDEPWSPDTGEVVPSEGAARSEAGTLREALARLERAQAHVAGAVARGGSGDGVKGLERLQRAMFDGAGVVRSAASLAAAATAVADVADELVGEPAAGGPPVASRVSAATTTAAGELANLVTVATALLRAAALRTETRGAHARSDFPGVDERWRRRIAQLRGKLAVLDPLVGPGTARAEAAGPRRPPEEPS
jgi:L-aspartate oxidase